MTKALNYRDSGAIETGASPLVVLHGLFGSADNWRSHIRQWQGNRRVIAVDLRNHGQSPHIDGMSYQAMAEDVVAVMDRLDIEKFDLLGHSMGGKVAMTLARRHPERVARLVVADVAPIAYEHGHDDIFRAHRLVEDAMPESRREADEAMAEAVDDRMTRQFLATNLVRDDQGVLVWRVGLDEIEAGYADIAAAPGGESAWEGPALLLRGERSHYVPDSVLEAVRAVLPQVRIETIADAGHWLHAEQPEAFMRAVNAFLNQDQRAPLGVVTPPAR
ncbi:alpha/beta fold hydrolase [Kushneria aurantia]|uniref:Alpha/beta fold hydrolase n=1 Tax=Kushneria aurantia TaxID=504092 RepID=A0ABV6G3Y5_9GAMM|nr:alpha/beta fold hydrolase [Kushneria aurantia]